VFCVDQIMVNGNSLQRAEREKTPEESARREIERMGIISILNIIVPKSMCCVPVERFPNRQLYNWADNMYLVSKHLFGFACTKELVLSHEYTKFVWLGYEEAREKLQWDSNKTALYELNCKLQRQNKK